MRDIDRRLAALEQQSQRSAILGIRLFEQSANDPALFHPVNGASWGDDSQARTREEIATLSAQGWQCVVAMRPSATAEKL